MYFDSQRAAVQSERKPAGDKKSESPSSQLLTSANFLLRGDLSSAASAALSASGQNVSTPGILKRESAIPFYPFLPPANRIESNRSASSDFEYWNCFPLFIFIWFSVIGNPQKKKKW